MKNKFGKCISDLVSYYSLLLRLFNLWKFERGIPFDWITIIAYLQIKETKSRFHANTKLVQIMANEIMS